jgi:multidrug transporter EmrE-like cation transporter
VNNIQYLIYGFLYGAIGQTLTFLQLQGSAKFGWYDKYPILTLLSSIPASWLFIKSVNYLILYFNGELWPGRFIGFSIGIIVFSIMSNLMFSEPFSQKTFISLLLAVGILYVQMFTK